MAKTKPAPVTVFKAFNSDWTCRDFKYEVGQTYEHGGYLSMCSSGFHACAVPFDCWEYYPYSVTFARVQMEGVSDERHEDSKVCAAKITIEAELALPEWIKAQAEAVVKLCRGAKKSLASKDEENAAATGDNSHAAATGSRGHAAATGSRGHAAATGYRGHAAATGYRGHAAATGDRGHAAATGDRGHAAATGDSGHAAATGDRGHAAVKGKNAIAFAGGINATAQASADGWLVLAAYDNDHNIVCVKTARVGKGGIKPDKPYRLTPAGKFEIV